MVADETVKDVSETEDSKESQKEVKTFTFESILLVACPYV